MNITTPAEIASVAWQGELVPPNNSYGGVLSPTKSKRPVVTIGQLEVWPAADALENEVGKKWVPPNGNAHYWLVRLACTLREPTGSLGITEAQQTLVLSPRASQQAARSVYAFSLFPDRLTVESKGEWNASLGPELKFGKDSAFKLGALGAKIEFKQVFPVIQSYGAGEPAPSWSFRPHAGHPLDGTQFVYAVLVEPKGADGIVADVTLTVTMQTQFGPVRFGTPREAGQSVQFDIQ